MRRVLLALAAAALCVACARACEPSPPPLQHFEADRYAGQWYTQRVWGTGASSMACSRMTYSLRYEAGSPAFDVRNDVTVLPYLNRLALTGVKRMPDANAAGRFMVHPASGPLNIHPTPSWIVAVAEDYRRAARARAARTALRARAR